MYLIKLFCIIFASVSFLVGCSQEQSFDEYFHEEMERHEDREKRPYSLVYQDVNVVHENDAIAIFEETNPNGEQIFIAYFEKENGKWHWRQSRGAEWEDFVNWSHMHNPPYIYSGATIDEAIAEIYAGDKKAEIITIEDNKRFWFAISNQENVDVKFVMEDGSEEYIEKIDYESIENEYES
ncbi:hypothetical protein MM300_07560 [Evansella sp. LMS18]|jgi:hypothetical protein|uniref:hypothetical protein n=1 Tax=Evansella sp. LMS18 TaxID=2924033 RepID=UPI0020D13572|nr:hypothetical protein [Evansella sp. LMS18]UTR12138.1 hypothetical protein MM300_07560 [Evansella sp. LMS18]